MNHSSIRSPVTSGKHNHN